MIKVTCCNEMTETTKSGSMPADKETSPQEDTGEVKAVLRELSGNWKTFVYIAGISMSLFHLWVNTIGVMPGIYRNAVHLGFVLIMIFLLYPSSKKDTQKYFKIDVIFAVLGAAVALYILFFEKELHLERASVPILRDYIFAGLAVVLLLYAAYRVVGWFIPALALFAICYALFLGNYMPGVFHHRGVTPVSYTHLTLPTN